MAHVLDAVIQLKDNFSNTLGVVENRVKDFQRTSKNMARDTYRMGKGLQSLGGSLIKSVTLPAVGATVAVAGMVSSLGWGRLTGLDAAQTQLKGLGYEAEDVDRIASQVRASVQGTVVTMAEGTSVAAGALAAGVKEGAELERYIRLVGSAAVGANRPVADMAMIFNRVQGQGKLMTMELNMIEQGMPGFAAAMSEHFGMTQEHFRKMVTDGKVSSTQFLDVMEGFAGGMADAYANSWAGMVANVKSNIGIIGETLLSGVFEQSKESIAEFLELLRSGEATEWAEKVAKPIGETFVRVVEGTKSVIGWFTSLESGTQKLIGKMALTAVAAGPLISVVGKLTFGVSKALYKFSDFAGALKRYGSVMGVITSPAYLVVAAIVALIAAGYLLYRNWDKIAAWAGQNFPNMREQIATAMEHIKNIFDGVVRFILLAWQQLAPMFTAQWAVIRNIFTVAIETIGGVISGLLQTFSGIVDFLTGVFTGDWKLAWQGVVDIFGGIFGGLKALARAPINAVIGMVNGLISGINKISLPDWVPGIGGKGISIPLIPRLAEGTLNWPGGIAQVHERGGEIIDLPRGSRVYPHDESVAMAREQGKTESNKHINIAKLADTLIVREEADIDKIATALVKKLTKAEVAYGGGW